MADLTGAILDRSSLPPSHRVGVVSTITPLTVALDGVPMPAINAMGGWLGEREPVLCVVDAGVVWVRDVLAPRPQTGTVQTITADKATVSAGGLIYSDVPVWSGTATVGAPVLLLWGTAGVVAIAGVPGAPAGPGAPIVDDLPEAPTPGGQDAERWEDAALDCRTTYVRTSRSGSYRTDGNSASRAYQGYYPGGSSASNTGWFFYGGATAAAGEAVSCTIRLERPREAGKAGPVAFRLQLHDGTNPAGSLPGLVGADAQTVNLSWGDSVVADLGAVWGQKLLDGTASGVALVYTGTAEYGCLYGPTGSAPLAGQLLIKYRRKVS